MLLKDLLEGLEYQATGSTEKEIADLVYDSRKVKPGCAFVCLCGANVDGHLYAKQAVEAGAVAVIAQHAVEVEGVTVVLVADTRYALAVLSAAYFGHPAKDLRVVGLTGTKGKTTTSYMIRSILEDAGIKTGLIGTIGTVIGEKIIKTENTTPESYEVQRSLREMADEGCQAAVIEASSIGLRDHRVSGFTFAIGLFTNFSPDHIGGNEHKSLEEYRACKALLFRQCELGIVNMDDENWQAITEGHTCQLETYGFHEEAQLRAKEERLLSRPGYLGVHFELEGPYSFGVDVDIPGHFSVYNALAAIAVCRHFGVTEENIRRGLNAVRVKGRVEPVKVPGNDPLLIDYAHNAVSMESLLATLREYHPKRLVVVFGCGGNRSKDRRYSMGEIGGRMADLSIITADNSRFEKVEDIIADIRGSIEKTGGSFLEIPDRKEAITYSITHAEPGDMIAIIGKGHEDYQEINGVRYPFLDRAVVEEVVKNL